MSNIYLTSDFHFGHNRDFLYQPRGFASIEEHDEVVIERFNSVVREEDEAIILGDLMLNDNEHGMECLRRLHGRLHILRGNHDSANRMALYRSLPAVVQIEDIINLKYKGYHFYCSHYPTLTSNNDLNKPMKARVLNLCGHSHAQDKWLHWNPWYCYHVELDAHSCFPVSIDTIIEDMRNNLPMKTSP